MGWQDYLFGFRGRISRAKAWLFFPLGLIAILPAEMASKALGPLSAALHPPHWSILATKLLLDAVMPAAMYAQAAIYAKRLHDRNRSAWWLAVFFGPGILMMIVFMVATIMLGDPRSFLPFMPLFFGLCSHTA